MEPLRIIVLVLTLQSLLVKVKSENIHNNSTAAFDKNSRKFFLLPGDAGQVCVDDVNDGGDWVVVQRRVSGSVDFNRIFPDYEAGFGHFDEDFWLGLENIHHLCKKKCDFRIDFSYDQRQYSVKYSVSLMGKDDTYRLKIHSLKSENKTLDHMFFEGTGSSTSNNEVFGVDPSSRTGSTKSCTYCGGWWGSKVMLNGMWNRTSKGMTWSVVTGKNSASFSEIKVKAESDVELCGLNTCAITAAGTQSGRFHVQCNKSGANGGDVCLPGWRGKYCHQERRLQPQKIHPQNKSANDSTESQTAKSQPNPEVRAKLSAAVNTSAATDLTQRQSKPQHRDNTPAQTTNCTKLCGKHNCKTLDTVTSCSCLTGYKNSSPLHCEDVDECQQPDICYIHTCVNNNGSYECKCQSGYQNIAPQTCVKVDVLALKTPTHEEESEIFLFNLRSITPAKIAAVALSSLVIAFVILALIECAMTVVTATATFATSKPMKGLHSHTLKRHYIAVTYDEEKDSDINSDDTCEEYCDTEDKVLSPSSLTPISHNSSTSSNAMSQDSSTSSKSTSYNSSTSSTSTTYNSSTLSSE